MTPVPSDRAVLRLVAPHPERFPPGATKPSALVFLPSSLDRQQTPPRLSVFDHVLTTVGEARTIYGRNDAAAFRLDVSDIIGITTEAGSTFLSVIYDPLSPPSSLLAGADGHAGIVGLAKTSQVTKTGLRLARDRLVELCSAVRE